MKKISLTILLFLTLVYATKAQSITVTGTVTSATDALPMPFVTVAIKGTTNAVATNMDGKFSLLNVRATDSLLFSFVGYTQQIIVVGNQTAINVKMVPSSKQLSEVTVTALASTGKNAPIGYSTQKIDGAEIQQSNTPNILSALSGKAAGVQIANADGVEGGTTRITIRGNNSINGNNQPLIVVDGIPIDNDPGLTNVGRGRDWGSAINNINMVDVEDITILKGGAASALYGARGANGVVLITMKKGAKQKGIGVSYNMMYKNVHPYRYRDVQNTYGGGTPNANVAVPKFELAPDGTPLFPILSTDPKFGYPGSSVSWGPKMEGQMIRWWNGEMAPWEAQPDNLSIPFRDGKTITQCVGRGGGEIGTMRVSLTRTKSTPIIYNSDYNQTAINTNSTINVSKKVSLGLSATYTDYNRLNSPMLGEDAASFNKGLLYSWPRSYRGEDLVNYQMKDGTRDPLTGYPYQYIDQYLWWNNYNNNTTLHRSVLLGGISLGYKITDWLTFTGRTGIDFSNNMYETKNKPVDLIGLQNGYYSESSQNDKSNNNEFLFSLSKKSFLKSNFDVNFNLGGSSWSRNLHGISAHSGTWYYPNWYSLSNFTPTTYGTDANGNVTVITKGDDPASLIAANTFYKKKINSFYGFLNVGYKEYLFVELTGRNDFTSTLPSDANSYFYPGMSVSYIASEALKFNKDWFSFCKIRAGASQTATDTDPYQTEFYYNTALHGGQQSSNYPSVIPPITLKPQRVNSYEAGTNLGFFKDVMTVDFTYYYKRSFDQIIKTPLPVSAGAGFALINEGILSNRGFEIIFGATVLNRKNLMLKTGVNFSRNRNKVVSLGEYSDTYILAEIWGENGPQMALKEGDDFGTIVGWDYVYKDGKPVVNEAGTEYLISPTRVPIGNASPDFLAGWSTQLNYKNFTLSTLIDAKVGGDIYSGSYVTGLQTGQSPETLKERDGGGLPYTDITGYTSNIGVILPGVHEDGSENTTVVHYLYKYMPNAGGWGHFLSKPGIVENTWVKFRELTLSYNLPSGFLKKLRVFQALSVSITSRDLFYIYSSLPDNINPEGIMGAGDAQGFEWGAMPGTRSLTFGVNARF
ncbi:MAG: SusC/RagA family TonB-linked outer membrane protein [Bacteroidetes bacterium]|nr:SusC/RagA family TonB-linked outer membrane protein [Bacteroidota bacterium]